MSLWFAPLLFSECCTKYIPHLQWITRLLGSSDLILVTRSRGDPGLRGGERHVIIRLYLKHRSHHRHSM